MADDLPELLLPDAASWRGWLVEHHGTSRGVWLVLHKRGGDLTTLAYEAAVQEALCFGWIDGQARSRNDASYRQRMTPRTARSPWSASNVARVARLEEEGRLHEAGRAAVRAAQADGRWDRAVAGPPTEPPDDLAAAIAADPRARQTYDVLTASNRAELIGHVLDAKRPETRRRRIETSVAMLARHEAPHPQRRRPD